MTTFGSGMKWTISSLTALALATATLATANMAHAETGLGRHKKTFAVPTPGKVSAGVFDAAGRQVRPLLYGKQLEVGEHSLEWDGLDREGNALPVGDYELRVLRTPGFTAHFVTQLGINPGMPLTDPAYRRNGRQWAGSHSGVTALASDEDGLYVAAATAEFVPIILKQSHDGTRRMWERYEFQPAQGAVSLTVAHGRLIFLQANGLAMLVNPETGAHTGQWDLKHEAVERDPKQYYNTGAKVYGVGTIDIAGREDTLVISHHGQNLLRWLDAEGKTVAEVAIPAPRGVCVDHDGRVLAISGDSVVEVSPAGVESVLIKELTAPLRLAVDPINGDILVAESAPSHRIKRFSAAGELLATYGREGGRQDGPYVPEDFRGVTSIITDAEGRFYIAEPHGAPRRTARFDREGEVLNEWYGPTGYFASAAPDPRDPSQVWYSPEEGWVVLAEIDYATGDWAVRETHRVGGRADGLTPGGLASYSMPPVVRYHEDRRYLVFGTSPPNIFLHVDGRLQPVVAGGQGGDLRRVRALVGEGAPEGAAGFQWHDLNDDGQVQPEEVHFLTHGMPSGPKIQAPVGEGFAVFAGGTTVRRLAPTTWHGPVPEYPDRWDAVATVTMPPRTAFGGFGFLERGADLFGVLACARDRHGPCFPTDRVGKVRLVRFGPDGQPQWSVGRAALRNPHDLANPSPPGDFHEATGFVGAVRGTVVVTDRSVRPATAWTEDGLYAGDFLDHRADDGLPDSFYRWWRTRDGVDTILNFDHEVPGAMVEHDGEVYWFANGWQCVPVYRITGWDGWERQTIPLRLAEAMPAAKAEGTGLLGRYFANQLNPGAEPPTQQPPEIDPTPLDKLSGNGELQPALERVDPQVWFSQGDWYGMQTEVWGAFGPPVLGTIDGPLTVRWVGELEAPLTEDFCFSVYADARVRLWLDGRQLVWGWNDVQTSRLTQPVRLEAGRRYAIRLDLQTDKKAPTASLNWESHSLDRERIPQRYLYPVGDGGVDDPDDQPRPATAPLDLRTFFASHGAVDTRSGVTLGRTEGGSVWVGYRRLDFGDGAAQLLARAHTWSGIPNPTRVEVRLDAPDGPLLGILDVPPADGPREMSLDLETTPTGIRDLYLINVRDRNDQWAAFTALRFE